MAHAWSTSTFHGGLTTQACFIDHDRHEGVELLLSNENREEYDEKINSLKASLVMMVRGATSTSIDLCFHKHNTING